MYYDRDGQTAKVIVFAILAVVLVGGSFLWNMVTADVTHEHANELANQWVREVFAPEEARTARVACQATDSDGNGYVSCTLNITRNGEEQLIPIECHSYVVANFGDSCRPLVPLTLGVRR
jgi:hypothetical protein